MDFQDRVKDWMSACFSDEGAADVRERLNRFIEEALELAQACGASREDAIALVDYVFSRPSGQPALEVGGVMVTLAGLCSASGFDMLDAGEVELARNWDRIEIIRAKRASRPTGSPLPQTP